MGLRARAGGGEAVLPWPERIYTEAWALLLAGGTVLLLVLLTEYESNWIWGGVPADSGQLDTLCIAGTAAITAWVLLAAMLLRTVTVRLRPPALARTTLLCRVVSFLWRRLSVFIRELPLTWKTLLCFLLYLAAIFAAGPSLAASLLVSPARSGGQSDGADGSVLVVRRLRPGAEGDGDHCRRKSEPPDRDGPPSSGSEGPRRGAEQHLRRSDHRGE